MYKATVYRAESIGNVGERKYYSSTATAMAKTIKVAIRLAEGKLNLPGGVPILSETTVVDADGRYVVGRKPSYKPRRSAKIAILPT